MKESNWSIEVCVANPPSYPFSFVSINIPFYFKIKEIFYNVHNNNQISLENNILF